MTNEVAKRTGQNDIGSFLEKNKNAVVRALPKHLTADRLLRVALTEIRRNDKLQKCKSLSLLGAIVQAAQLGLIPDSLIGHAYLVPYKDECQLQLGYKGLMTLAYQSGQVLNIFAGEVYNDDIFEFEYGLKPAFKHIPNLESSHDEKNIKCWYAIAYLKNGGAQFVVLTKAEVERHRRYSKVSNSQYSPWATNYTEMAKKTAIRVLCKYLPQSTENFNLYAAVALDEQADSASQQNDLLFDNIIDAEPIKPESKADAIVSKLGSNAIYGHDNVGLGDMSGINATGSEPTIEELMGDQPIMETKK